MKACRRFRLFTPILLGPLLIAAGSIDLRPALTPNANLFPMEIPKKKPTTLEELVKSPDKVLERIVSINRAPPKPTDGWNPVESMKSLIGHMDLGTDRVLFRVKF